MEFQTHDTVSFSGNRSLIAPPALFEDDIEEEVRTALRETLLALHSSGKRIFLSGGAVGFDILAAEVVVELRAVHCDIQLIIVAPFRDQDAKYPDCEKLRYRSLIEAADSVVTVEERYSTGAYHIRNQFLVDNCSQMVVYSNGKGRGTLSTIRRAAKRGVPIINIYDLLNGSECAEQLSLNF